MHDKQSVLQGHTVLVVFTAMHTYLSVFALCSCLFLLYCFVLFVVVVVFKCKYAFLILSYENVTIGSAALAGC